MSKPASVSTSEWNELQSALTQFKTSDILPSDLINTNPDNLTNSIDMEQKWAEKAFKHAEIYFNIISSIEQKKITLTKIDDEIYQHFRNEFKDLNIYKLTDDILKSDVAKLQWREFCNKYDDNKVTDFNMATLLRLESNQDYSPDNTTIAPRIQFLAIEIARNREGANSAVFKAKK